jgi:hypothetical protein
MSAPAWSDIVPVSTYAAAKQRAHERADETGRAYHVRPGIAAGYIVTDEPSNSHWYTAEPEAQR